VTDDSRDVLGGENRAAQGRSPLSDVQARGCRRSLIPVNATFETFSTETAAETMLSADAATIAAGTCERRDLRG